MLSLSISIRPPHLCCRCPDLCDRQSNYRRRIPERELEYCLRSLCRSTAQVTYRGQFSNLATSGWTDSNTDKCRTITKRFLCPLQKLPVEVQQFGGELGHRQGSPPQERIDDGRVAVYAGHGPGLWDALLLGRQRCGHAAESVSVPGGFGRWVLLVRQDTYKTDRWTIFNGYHGIMDVSRDDVGGGSCCCCCWSSSEWKKNNHVDTCVGHVC